MAVLNSNRVIDACGNTVANPGAKTCAAIVQQPWTKTDTVVAGALGVCLVVFVVALAFALFKKR